MIFSNTSNTTLTTTGSGYFNTTTGTYNINNQIQYPILELKHTSLMSINNKKGETIFSIEQNGEIKYLKDGEMKVLDNEKELSMLFVMIISELSGYSYIDKNELLSNVIKNYRSGRIDEIFDK